MPAPHGAGPAHLSRTGIRTRHGRRWQQFATAAALAALVGTALCSVYLAAQLPPPLATTGTDAAFVLGHAVLFTACALRAAGSGAATPRALATGAIAALVTVVAALILWLGPGTSFRELANGLHVVSGTVCLALVARVLLHSSARRGGWQGVAGAAPVILLLVAPISVAGVRAARAALAPAVRHDAGRTYRFLTATTSEDAGEPAFPSALRALGRPQASTGCTSAGCHAGYDNPHLNAGRNPLYLAARNDFQRRKGAESTGWCRGCHEPETHRESRAAVPAPDSFACTSCHTASETRGLFGSAALLLNEAPPLGRACSLLPPAPLLRPVRHSAALYRRSYHRSAEFCGACHRKHWSLPQNGYRWMEGPDEYAQWVASPQSGRSAFAVTPAVARACADCHAAHGSRSSSRPAPPPFLALDAFLRRESPASVAPVDRSLPAAPGEAAVLDVVVRNIGIAHDFPSGMPDLRESWLEVRVLDAAGRLLAGSGLEPPGSSVWSAPHSYRLVALDAAGRPVVHGDLDRMVAVAEWRRIPAGSADLARYRLPPLARAAALVEIRLWRRRRPEFLQWANLPADGPPELLARATLEPLGPRKPLPEAPPGTLSARWRNYADALSRARAFPSAIQALTLASATEPGAPETILALGKVFLEEGDLLAAREQFQRLTAGSAANTARAWEAAVLRRMGQPEEAAGLLAPLVRRFPRDPRLRFEMGRLLMDQLRNADAARSFEAQLALDPLDRAAHFNLMLLRQRQGQLSAARRAEVLYRLLAEEEYLPATSGAWPEAQPLHIHELEPPP